MGAPGVRARGGPGGGEEERQRGMSGLESCARGPYAQRAEHSVRCQGLLGACQAVLKSPAPLDHVRVSLELVRRLSRREPAALLLRHVSE